MLRRELVVLGLAGLLSVPSLAGEEGERSCRTSGKQACAWKAAASARLRCSLTGTIVESCCCVQREGKLHCTLAKKDVETCCCQPISVKEKAAEDKPVGSAPETAGDR